MNVTSVHKYEGKLFLFVGCISSAIIWNDNLEPLFEG